MRPGRRSVRRRGRARAAYGRCARAGSGACRTAVASPVQNAESVPAATGGAVPVDSSADGRQAMPSESFAEPMGVAVTITPAPHTAWEFLVGPDDEPDKYR